MKKIIALIFLACVLCTYGFMQGDPQMVPVASAPAGLSWTNITFFLNWEANDTTGDYNMQTASCGSECEYSAGDTSGAYTAATLIEYPTSSGYYALQSNADNEYVTFGVTNGTEISGTISSMGTQLTMTGGTWSADIAVLRCRNGSNYHGITLLTAASGNLTLRIYNGTAHLYTSSGLGLVADTTYNVTVGWNYTTDSYKVWVDGAEVISTTDAYDAFTATELQAGVIGTTYRTALHQIIAVSSAMENLNGWLDAVGYNE